MANFFKNLFSGFSKPTEEDSLETSERLQEYEQIFKLAKKKNLSDEKKAELEALYVQLMRKSDNVTSGQLQFLGLAEIKERMGPNKWARLQSKVYATAEDVIQRYVTLSDIYFLFKEDRYVIIFTQSTDEEINRKVAAISDEIMRRFAELDDEDLQSLQIQQEIKKIDVETFLDNEFSDMLDYVFKQYNPGYQPGGLSTDAPSAHLLAKEEVHLSFHYLPLWDVDKKAVTTWFCISQQEGDEKPLFEGYKALFQKKTLQEKAAFDIAMLEKVVIELEKLEYEERKVFLICPVQHETLYNFSTYDEYKNVCQTIPNNQRSRLVFMVTNSENFSLPAKDPFWFIPLLKDYCGGVAVDIPMRENIIYPNLKNMGATGIGVQVLPIFPDEEKNLEILASFNAQARYMKMKKTFALNVETEEMANRLIGMGFTTLGGQAILPPTPEVGMGVDRVKQLSLYNLIRD